MQTVITPEIKNLLNRAQQAAETAYAPYSHFRVGAALLLADGSVSCGCNVGNASYGATVCAERVAVFAAVAAGKLSPAQSPQMLTVTALPCALCLQVLAEFAKPDMPIWIVGKQGVNGGQPQHFLLKDLLPHAFKL